jgi:hypothetical protein
MSLYRSQTIWFHHNVGGLLGVTPTKEKEEGADSWPWGQLCWVWGPKGQMSESVCHSPWRALWALHPKSS